MIPEGEFQDQGGPLKPRRPWWFTAILIILVLPSFATPWVLADAPAGSLLATLIKWFPAFLVLAAVCAWLSYPQRRDVAWILTSVMILASLSLFMI